MAEADGRRLGSSAVLLLRGPRPGHQRGRLGQWGHGPDLARLLRVHGPPAPAHQRGVPHPPQGLLRLGRPRGVPGAALQGIAAELGPGLPVADGEVRAPAADRSMEEFPRHAEPAYERDLQPARAGVRGVQGVHGNAARELALAPRPRGRGRRALAPGAVRTERVIPAPDEEGVGDQAAPAVPGYCGIVRGEFGSARVSDGRYEGPRLPGHGKTDAVRAAPQRGETRFLGQFGVCS
mmetsp:Transcript_27401/g.91066  ORF Transcript_27401/g.91066 Transcript_27401/m.91066 type:complete len:236 (-) Transcript_27401:1071-1778(-)